MAKEITLTQLKKGKAEFNLIGKAKVSDYTFKVDIESSKADSDWVYNQMNLGVDCGSYGVIYADMMGGYGTARENKVFVHGKKTNDNNQTVDDFKNFFEVVWEDRFDKEVLETCGDMCFITVGLEKDDEGKTVYKKFLTEYDAIKYAQEHLTKDMIINVKGNLTYNRYNDVLQVKKEIRSIALSKVEEKDFKATFTQTVLLDKDSIGKIDKETLTIPITTYIIEYARENNGKPITYKVGNKIKKGTMLPFLKIFDFKVSKETIEQDKKKLKLFKVRGNKLTQMSIDGYFSRGELNTVSITEDDIPDDIKELIELGYVDKDEILGQMALKNGSQSPEIMILKQPHIKYNKTDNGSIPTVDKVVDIYEQQDLNIELILKSLGVNLEKKEIKDEDTEVDLDKNENILDKITENESSDDDDNWLKDL